MSPERWGEFFNKHFSTLSSWADWDLRGSGGGRHEAHFVPSLPSEEAEAYEGPRAVTVDETPLHRCSLCLRPLPQV